MKIKVLAMTISAMLAFGTFAMAQESKPSEGQTQAQGEETQGKRAGKRGFGRRGAGKFGEGRGHKRGKMAMHGLKQLNLSEGQQQQLKSIRESYKAKFQPQREEMKALAGKKRDGIITPEEETRFKEIRTEMKASGKLMRDEIMNLLTPEQKTQLEQRKQEMRQKMEERRKMRQT